MLKMSDRRTSDVTSVSSAELIQTEQLLGRGSELGAGFEGQGSAAFRLTITSSRGRWSNIQRSFPAVLIFAGLLNIWNTTTTATTHQHTWTHSLRLIMFVLICLLSFLILSARTMGACVKVCVALVPVCDSAWTRSQGCIRTHRSLISSLTHTHTHTLNLFLPCYGHLKAC